MKVMICDKCGAIMKSGDKGIYGTLTLSEIFDGASFNIQGIEVDLLRGDHFCSVKCVKEKLNESN